MKPRYLNGSNICSLTDVSGRPTCLPPRPQVARRQSYSIAVRSVSQVDRPFPGANLIRLESESLQANKRRPGTCQSVSPQCGISVLFKSAQGTGRAETFFLSETARNQW